MVDLGVQLESLTLANRRLRDNINAQQRTIDDLQTHILQLEKMREVSCDEWIAFGDLGSVEGLGGMGYS